MLPYIHLPLKGFQLTSNAVLNAEKDVLTHLPNPNIKALKKQCGRFRRLTFTEEATRSDTMPVHVILKFIWEHFKGVVTCTSTLMLPWQPRLDSHVVRNLHFLKKRGFLSFELLRYLLLFFSCQVLMPRRL